MSNAIGISISDFKQNTPKVIKMASVHQYHATTKASMLINEMKQRSQIKTTTAVLVKRIRSSKSSSAEQQVLSQSKLYKTLAQKTEKGEGDLESDSVANSEY